MKILKLVILTWGISIYTIGAQEGKKSDFSFPVLEGPYMGQKPPGMVAEPFAPGIISKVGD